MGSKKGIKLLVLILVLGVCIGIYVWLDNYKSKQNDLEKKDTSVVLIDTKKNAITEIKYTRKDKAVTLKYDSKKEKWYYEEHKDWPINQQTIETMVDTLKQVTATRTIDTKEELKEYGLDKPEIVIEYKTKNNKNYKINIGRTAQSYGSYVMIDGDKQLYTIAENTQMEFDKDDIELIEVENIPSIKSNLVYSVDAKGETLNMKAEYDGDITEVDSGSWIIKKPYDKEIPGMTSSFTEYFVNLETFAFTECVDYNPKKLSKYGFDKPQLSMNLKFMVEEEDNKKDSDKEDKKKYKKDSITLVIGDPIVEEVAMDGEEKEKTITSYYAMIKGGKRIYTVDETTASNLLNASAFKFIYDAINNAELTEYKDVKVKIGKDKYTIKKTRKADDKGGYDVSYTFNGTKFDESKGDEMYSGMTELVYAKEKGDKKIKKDKVIASFEYTGKKDGAKDTIIKFLNYDDNYYRVNKDGIEYFLVSKIEVDNYLDGIKEFAKKNKK